MLIVMITTFLVESQKLVRHIFNILHDDGKMNYILNHKHGKMKMHFPSIFLVSSANQSKVLLFQFNQDAMIFLNACP